MLPDQLRTVFRTLLSHVSDAAREPGDGEPAQQAEPTAMCDGRHPPGLPAQQFSGLTGPSGYLARMAYYEAASVHAFVQLADELQHHGAPAYLITAAEMAARQEVSHAQVCKALAITRGATPPSPAVNPTPQFRSLERIAIDNVAEGCVREAFGALVGLYQAIYATAPDVRAAMVTIADDETAHAAFSFELARWLDTRLSDDSRGRVKRARDKALAAMMEHALFSDDVSWRSEVGLPSNDTLFELAQGFQRALDAA